MKNSLFGEYDFSSRKQPRKSVHGYLDDLFEKRPSTREEALAAIVEALTHRLEHEFVEKKFATVLYRCLNSVKKGSAKEMHLAAQAISLLAMIIGGEDNEQEIYRELLPELSKALKSKPKTLKVFDCLAIVTFFCAANSQETEIAMQVIWKFINPENHSDVNARKDLADVLVAAIPAWLFLLTTLDGWRLSLNYWKGAISYFSNLLENDDESVRVAATVALAVIFETNSVDKFCRSEAEKAPTDKMNSCIQKLVQNGYPKASVLIGKDTLTLSSWSQIVQLNYLKSFLGDRGFKIHLKENEKLQNVFEFTPSYDSPDKGLYVPVIDKATVTYFAPRERDLSALSRAQIKQDWVWRRSQFDKARTQLLNKNRNLSESEMDFWSSD